MKTKISAILVSAAIVLGVFSLFNDSNAAGGPCPGPDQGNTLFACSSDICDNAGGPEQCWIQVD